MGKLPAPELPKWIEDQLPLGVKRYLLTIENYKMHVMEWGEGYPVLMLHGNPTWGFLYRKVVQNLLGKEVRLIVPDLIGLGFSSKPSSLKAHTVDNHCRWIQKLLDQLDLDQLVFVGQDWGGPIGIRALSDRPKLMRGLVVMNTIIGPPKEGFKPTWFHRFSWRPFMSNFYFRVLGFPQNGLHKVQGNPDSIQGDVRKAYMYPLNSFWKRVAPLALARMVPNNMDHPTVEGLRKNAKYIQSFNGPSAIVWGHKDPVLGRALSRIQNLLPNADLYETQGGHFIQEEEPVLIAKTIIDIVDKVKNKSDNGLSKTA